jgi:hypothetical protein
MAKVRRNLLWAPTSGAVGGVVIVHQKNRTYMRARPRSPRYPPSEKQQQQRQLWRDAASYYRRVKADPWLLEQYERVRHRIAHGRDRPLASFTAADFAQPPSVTAIVLNSYAGNAGEIIEITARDDFAVRDVDVTLRDQAGTVIESGLAAAPAQRHGNWLYTTKTTLPLGKTIVIEAVAHDYPCHAGCKTVEWSRPV